MHPSSGCGPWIRRHAHTVRASRRAVSFRRAVRVRKGAGFHRVARSSRVSRVSRVSRAFRAFRAFRSSRADDPAGGTRATRGPAGDGPVPGPGRPVRRAA
ncbi:hypothetical protein EBF04_02345 [Streptomyces sp. I6]|nr:hypothetical protein EBF04_02345 [Streptomyces sp. I6]